MEKSEVSSELCCWPSPNNNYHYIDSFSYSAGAYAPALLFSARLNLPVLWFHCLKADIVRLILVLWFYLLRYAVEFLICLLLI